MTARRMKPEHEARTDPSRRRFFVIAITMLATGLVEGQTKTTTTTTTTTTSDGETTTTVEEETTTTSSSSR